MGIGKFTFKKGKMAVIITIGVAGGILMINSFTAILPKGISVVYQFIMGLGLVLLA